MRRKYLWIVLLILILCVSSVVILLKSMGDSFFSTVNLTEEGLSLDDISTISQLKIPSQSSNVRLRVYGWQDHIFYLKFEIDQEGLDKFLSDNGIKMNGEKDLNVFGNNNPPIIEWFNSEDTLDSKYSKPFRTTSYVEVKVKIQSIGEKYVVFVSGFST